MDERGNEKQRKMLTLKNHRNVTKMFLCAQVEHVPSVWKRTFEKKKKTKQVKFKDYRKYDDSNSLDMAFKLPKCVYPTPDTIVVTLF